MKFSQVLVGAGIGVLGSIAVGAILLTSGLFQLGTGKNPSPSPKKPGLLNGPDDLPVLARGGSAEFFSDNWTPISDYEYYDPSGVDATNVSIDGVSTTKNGSPEMLTASNWTSSWYMALTFRDYKDDDDPGHTLNVCVNQLCATGLAISPKGPLYLFDLNKNGKFHGPKNYDGHSRLAYTVKQCPNDADSIDSHCDHIKTITPMGIDFTTGSATTIKSGTLLYCIRGACDIGFGPLPQLSK